MKRANRITATAIAVLLCLSSTALPAFSPAREGRRCVVKVYVTLQREDFSMPWQTRRPGGGTGTGFLIGNKRILTNAHLVADAKFLQVQKDGDPRRFRAEVMFVAHDCDLAVISVSEPEFFEGTSSLSLASSLPDLNEKVTVLGYPMGGQRLSVTQGVVSRLDYSLYSHSGVDQHLVLQVDAAINPGNSGGPILDNGRVVGVAFQGLAWADNIGYAIPLPVVRRFLKDIEDGYYNGYPELGAAVLEMRNPALRTAYQLPADKAGVVVYYLDPFGAARNHLQVQDVLLAVDGRDIASDGTIAFAGTRQPFHQIMEDKQWGASVVFDVWRNGFDARIQVPLRNPTDPFIFRNLYDQRPQYLVVGGLVFSTLTKDYLRSRPRGQSGRNSQQLNYYAQYAKMDDLYKGRVAFVVLTRRLPHPVNAYMDDFVEGILEDVNGRPIGSLSDVKIALASPQDGFHVMRFVGMDDTLVLHAETTKQADPEIFRAYGIAKSEYIEELPK